MGDVEGLTAFAACKDVGDGDLAFRLPLVTVVKPSSGEAGDSEMEATSIASGEGDLLSNCAHGSDIDTAAGDDESPDREKGAAGDGGNSAGGEGAGDGENSAR
ncbi:hypothetical protein JYU34_008900 [Plutella xylostella]|uniref:Uncharacterized protein n=1 Tax=Plutella xylostella TaxID=51655 RepID=A0ABQ7QMU5_PLUXY|nr:hypothetical protein JYU34_008900 [Plutella xylostella]